MKHQARLEAIARKAQSKGESRIEFLDAEQYQARIESGENTKNTVVRDEFHDQL